MNPYDVLGVSPQATDEELTRAYKTLAKRYHPDLHPNDPNAADRMGEINRAYDNVKAMRQRGESCEAYNAYPGAGGYGNAGNGDAYDPFETMRRTYRYTYTRGPRRSPMGVILGVMMMVFFVRLILSILFGGYGSAYYVNTRGMDSVPYMPQGYGYYETIP